MSRARPSAASNVSDSSAEKRLSRWSRSPTLLSIWLTTESSASRRSVSTSSVRRLLASICSAAAASALPCTSNFSAAPEMSRRIAPVPAWNAFICSSKRELVVPLRSPMSFMVVTNSATRPDSVVSIVLRFSVAPPSTSCSSTFASRSRSNSAEVSLRSMPCVSIISVTAADAAFCERSIAPRAVVSRSPTVRRDRGGRLAARIVDLRGDLLAVLRQRLGEGHALRLDRLHRIVGDAFELGRELLALRAERAQEDAGLLVEHALQVGAALIDVRGQFFGLGGETARDFGADAEQRALHLAGILLQRSGHARGDRGQRALGFAGAALDRAGHLGGGGGDLARRLVGARPQRL